MKMKKIISVLAAAAAACTLSVSAFAGDLNTGEKAIIDYLNGVVINNAKIAPDYIAQAEAYFLADGVDVTEEAAKSFIADADKVAAYCVNGGVTADKDGYISILSLAKLDDAAEAAMLDSASALATDLGLTFSYNPTLKTGVVTDAKGVVVGKISAGIINDTGFGGFEYILTASGVLLGLVAVSAVASKKRGLSK